MIKTRNVTGAALALALAAGMTLPSSASALSDRTKNTMGGAAIGAGVDYIVGGKKGATGVTSWAQSPVTTRSDRSPKVVITLIKQN